MARLARKTPRGASARRLAAVETSIDEWTEAQRAYLEVGIELRALPSAGRREYNPREAG